LSPGALRDAQADGEIELGVDTDQLVFEFNALLPQRTTCGCCRATVASPTGLGVGPEPGRRGTTRRRFVDRGLIAGSGTALARFR
jgi:hypothetical protein